MKNKGNISEIAQVFFKLGLFAFGGPAAHVAMMQDEIVEKRKWMDRQHFLDLMGATNLIPGPNSTEMTMHCGYTRGGVLGLFVAGFGFKMGLVPFHQWLPDTYEGAPTPITALLAAATKKAGFAATIRIVVLGMVVLHVDWTFALAIIAVMTMTIGNIAAIMQKNISRMLAYSSIAHAGYILIGLAVAPHTSLGLQGSMYQIMNHAVMKGAAFIAIAGIATTLAVTHIDKLQGLGRRMPITALGLVIALFALAGIPPLSGFWSKIMLFGSALDAGSVLWWAPWLAIAGVLNSALSLAYYGWLTRKMYFEGETQKRVIEPKSVMAVMIFSTIFLVGFGVYPDPLIKFVEFATPVIGLGIMP